MEALTTDLLPLQQLITPKLKRPETTLSLADAVKSSNNIRPLAELRLRGRNREFSSSKINFKVINGSNQITT